MSSIGLDLALDIFNNGLVDLGLGIGLDKIVTRC